jgi:hypothetical protein
LAAERHAIVVTQSRRRPDAFALGRYGLQLVDCPLHKLLDSSATDWQRFCIDKPIAELWMWIGRQWSVLSAVPVPFVACVLVVSAIADYVVYWFLDSHYRERMAALQATIQFQAEKLGEYRNRAPKRESGSTDGPRKMRTSYNICEALNAYDDRASVVASRTLLKIRKSVAMSKPWTRFYQSAPPRCPSKPSCPDLSA